MLPISDSLVRQYASPKSYNRGEEYYQAGAVIDLQRRGQSIYAQVEGNEIDPYRVQIDFARGDVETSECNCKYDAGGWCKHIVATLLACLYSPTEIVERPSLSALLDRIDWVQTQGLVQELVRKHPELLDEIDWFVSAIAKQNVVIVNPGEPRSKIDTTHFSSRAKRIFREGLRELEYGTEEDPITDEIVDLIDETQAFIHNGDGLSAIDILEAITLVCARELGEVNDYGWEGDDVCRSLDRAWTAASLSAQIDTAEATDLEIMLKVWQDELSTSFEMSLSALAQGWTDPTLKQILNGEDTRSLWPESRPTFADELAEIRLEILDRDRRYAEYLNLATAEGMTRQYLIKLAALGEIDRVMVAAQTQMDTTDTAFALAQVLRDNSHNLEALKIAKLGIELTGIHVYEFALWTQNLAIEAEDRSLALSAAILAFKTKPSLWKYQQINELAGEEWLQIKPELLDVLRQADAWSAIAAKVDIFLHEGEIEAAIAAVKSDNYYHSSLIHRVMDAALTTHPNWVIDRARPPAESIMNRGKAESYQEAVEWLKKVRAAYLAQHKDAEWSAYRSQLVELHGRKRKLMELFKSLG
jgi:uncharacterized Zn finger protein